MDASETVANYFSELLEKMNRQTTARPSAPVFSEQDQVIFYIVSTRCEMDINGIESVFDQLLTETELQLLIDSLRKVDAIRLADLFDQALQRLRSAGYFDHESTMVSDLKDSQGVRMLADLEQAIRENDGLWELDERLACVIRSEAPESP